MDRKTSIEHYVPLAFHQGGQQDLTNFFKGISRVFQGFLTCFQGFSRLKIKGSQWFLTCFQGFSRLKIMGSQRFSFY